MVDAVRWGIVGTGQIASAFATALDTLDDGVLGAVASRTESAALAFAEGRPDVGVYVGPEAVTTMVEEATIDAVYIATPHPRHATGARAALSAGLPTLVEKPLTTSYQSTDALLRLSADTGAFVMEAYWTRFLPGSEMLLAMLDAGVIGQVVHLHADLGFAVPQTMRRMLEPGLGGGSTLDLGPYTIGLAIDVLGQPNVVRAVGSLTSEGVDQEMCLALGFPNGAVAALTTSMRSHHIGMARIDGTAGHIIVPGPIYSVPRIEVHAAGREPSIHNFDVPHGHRLMIAHVQDCIREGVQESPRVPHEWSRAVARVTDLALSAVGVARAVEA
jgi:predicted dehydrogenase